MHRQCRPRLDKGLHYLPYRHMHISNEHVISPVYNTTMTGHTNHIYMVTSDQEERDCSNSSVGPNDIANYGVDLTRQGLLAVLIY